jgi:hypothetical protein
MFTGGLVHYFANNFGAQIFETFLKIEIGREVGDVLLHQVLNPVLRSLPHVIQYVK